jgi:hypothetical protein
MNLKSAVSSCSSVAAAPAIGDGPGENALVMTSHLHAIPYGFISGGTFQEPPRRFAPATDAAMPI